MTEKHLPTPDERPEGAVDPEQARPLPRDPKDAIFLVAAIATGAEFLINGDKDLLESTVSIATRIVSAAEFASAVGIV